MPEDLLEVKQTVRLSRFLSNNDAALTVITATKNFETVTHPELLTLFAKAKISVKTVPYQSPFIKIYKPRISLQYCWCTRSIAINKLYSKRKRFLHPRYTQIRSVNVHSNRFLLQTFCDNHWRSYTLYFRQYISTRSEGKTNGRI